LHDPALLNRFTSDGRLLSETFCFIGLIQVFSTPLSNDLLQLITARCTLVQSAVLLLHVACPSVRDVGGSGPRRLEILETNCTDN